MRPLAAGQLGRARGAGYAARVTRPAFHVDVAASAVNNIAQPAGSIQTSGFPANSKFSSANANWLFRRLGEWGRELDAASLRAEHWLDPATPQLVAGNGVAVPTGAGLGPLTPSDGGIYYLGGRLVDLSAAAIAAKYSGAFTFPSGTVSYLHARVDTASGGSSYGELIASINVSEPGSTAIASVATDATDVTSITSLVTNSREVGAGVAFTGDVSLQGAAEVIGSGLTIQAPTIINSTLSSALSSSSDAIDISQSGSGYALDATKSGAGTATVRVRNTGTGLALHVIGGTGTDGTYLVAGAGQRALLVEGATGTTTAVFQATGAASALGINGGGAGTAALSVAAGGGNTPGISSTGSGTGAAVVAASSSSANAVGLSATANSTSARAISATGSASVGATSSRAVFADGQQGAGVEARSSAYYALLVQGDATSPTFPALHVVGQDADPGDTLFGGLVAQATMNQWRYPVAGYGYRSMLSMGTGSAYYAVASNTGGIVTENAGVFSTVLSVSALNASGQGHYGAPGARVRIRAVMEARSLSAAAANTVNLRLLDMTNGGSQIALRTGVGTGAGAGFQLLHLSTEWQRTIVWEVVYAPPNNGDLTVRLEVQRGTANGIAVRDPVLEILGTF